MHKDKAAPHELTALRRQAAAPEPAVDLEELSPQDLRDLVRDLRTQNEALRQSGRKLQASRDKYFDLYNLAPVGYLTVDHEGLILETNRTAAALLGVETNDLLTQPLSRFVAPEDQDTFHTHHRQACQARTRQTCELKMSRGDGSQFYARLESMVVQRDGQSGDEHRPSQDPGDVVCRVVLSDVSEWIRTAHALRETNARLDALIEAIPDVIYFKDAQGRNLAVNKAYEKLVGLPKQDILHKTDAQILPPALAAQCQRSDQEAIKKQQLIRIEEQLTGGRGESIFFDTIKVPLLDEQGNANGLVGISRDITEQVQALETLRESEERYRTMIDAMDDLIHVVDRDLRLVLFNAACHRAFAASGIAQDPTGMEILEFCPFLPDGACEEYERVLENGEPLVTEEKTIVRGRTVWTETRKIPILDEAGKTQRVVTVVRDITDQVQAHEMLGTYASQQVALLQLSASLAALLDERDVCRQVVRELHDTLGYEHLGLYLVDEDTGERVLYANIGWPDPEPLQRIPPGQGLSERPLLDSQLHYTPAVTHAPRYVPGLNEGGAEVDVPLRVGDKVLGVLVVESREPDAFDKGDFAVLMAVANQAGVAIERARAHQAVRKAQARYRSLFDGVPVGLFRGTPAGQILDANLTLVRMLGYPDRDSLLMINAVDTYMSPLALEHLRAVVKREGRLRNWKQRMRRLDGTSIWVEMNALIVRDDDGQILHYEGTLENITERVQAEQALRESEEKYRLLVENANEAIVVVSPEGKFTVMNNAAAQFMGGQPDDFTGKTLWDVLPKETADQRMEGLNMIIQSGRGQVLETRNPVLGEVHWFRSSIQPLRDSTGEITGVLSLSTDITERIRAERALQESEEKYRLLVENASEAISAVDQRGRFIVLNNAAAQTLGGQPQDFVGKTLWDALPQEFADEMWAAVEKIIRSGQGRISEIHVPVHGRMRWFRSSLQPIRDKAGETTSILNLSTDITERKQAEAALQRRNRELMLLDQASRAFSSSLNLDQVLATVLRETCHLLDAVSGSVWLVDARTGEIVCRQDAGPHSEVVRGWRLAPGQGIAGRMVESGESVIVPDTRNDAYYFSELDKQTGLELRSLLGVPLRVKDKVIGVLHVTDTAVDRFEPADLALVELLAATAAIAIENAQLYEQARQDAETRAILLHEVNHRVKNNLTSILGVLSLEMGRDVQNVADFQAVMHDLQARIRGLATVHDMLSVTRWAPLPLDDLVEQVIRAALGGSSLRHKVRVTVTSPDEPLLLTPKQATALAVITNELTTNSIKYAFRGRERGRIDVHITAGGEGRGVTLKFRNDGPGWPQDVLQGQRKSVGLRLVRLTVRSPLRGQVVFHNDAGAATTITFTPAPLDTPS